MSLSDPFSQTSELAKSGLGTFGEALQILGAKTGQRREQQIQQDNALGILTKMGLYSPEKGLDTEKAASAGVEWSPTDGTIRIAPKRESPSVGIYTATPEGDVTKTGEVPRGSKVITPKSGLAATVTFAEKNAPSIADSYEAGDYGILDRVDARTRSAVTRLLAERGVRITEPSLGYKASQSSMANARVQEQKVESAVSAQALLDSSYDPKTGNYMVPPSQHVELALAGARMLSPTGVVSQEIIEELRQGTVREAMSKILISAGFDPKEVGGSTQSVVNMFAKLIEREGTASQEMLENLKKGKTTDFKKILAESKARKSKSVADVAGLTGGKRPENAAYYSESTKKYYDAQGNEVQ